MRKHENSIKLLVACNVNIVTSKLVEVAHTIREVARIFLWGHTFVLSPYTKAELVNLLSWNIYITQCFVYVNLTLANALEAGKTYPM